MIGLPNTDGDPPRSSAPMSWTATLAKTLFMTGLGDMDRHSWKLTINSCPLDIHDSCRCVSYQRQEVVMQQAETAMDLGGINVPDVLY